MNQTRAANPTAPPAVNAPPCGVSVLNDPVYSQPENESHPHGEVRWHMDPAEAGLERARLLKGLDVLEQGRARGWHAGGQLAISRHGRPVVEMAAGEAAPGVPITPDTLTAWFSACKPLTACAVALLYDQGSLDLDDRVVTYIPQFRNGKESCTLRHVLTHTGGFAGAGSEMSGGEMNGGEGGHGGRAGMEWEEVIDRACRHKAEYRPGEKAGYHSTAGWYILGEIVRIVDGRPIDRFLAEEILAPLGMEDTCMGIPVARQEVLRERLARVHLGSTERRHFASEAFIERFNGAEEIARVNPSGGVRGPARELARLYDWLLNRGEWQGRQLLDKRTVELFTACHRWGLPDATLLGAPLAWGLGFGLHGNADNHRGYSRRLFGHSGMVSTVGLGDPATGLACVAVTTGLLDPMTNARRLRELTGIALEALLPG